MASLLSRIAVRWSLFKGVHFLNLNAIYYRCIECVKTQNLERHSSARNQSVWVCNNQRDTWSKKNTYSNREASNLFGPNMQHDIAKGIATPGWGERTRFCSIEIKSWVDGRSWTSASLSFRGHSFRRNSYRSCFASLQRVNILQFTKDQPRAEVAQCRDLFGVTPCQPCYFRWYTMTLKIKTDCKESMPEINSFRTQ